MYTNPYGVRPRRPPRGARLHRFIVWVSHTLLPHCHRLWPLCLPLLCASRSSLGTPPVIFSSQLLYLRRLDLSAPAVLAVDLSYTLFPHILALPLPCSLAPHPPPQPSHSLTAAEVVQVEVSSDEAEKQSERSSR